MLLASSVTTTLDPPLEARSGFDDAGEPEVERAASRSKPPIPEFSFFAFFSFLVPGASLRVGVGSFRFGAFRAVSAFAMFSFPSKILACEAATPFTLADETKKSPKPPPTATTRKYTR